MIKSKIIEKHRNNYKNLVNYYWENYYCDKKLLCYD